MLDFFGATHVSGVGGEGLMTFRVLYATRPERNWILLKKRRLLKNLNDGKRWMMRTTIIKIRAARDSLKRITRKTEGMANENRTFFIYKDKKTPP